MNLLYSFTAECIVFYTGVSLNDRFTRYLKFQNPDLQKRNVVMSGESDIVPDEPEIVPCEPDIVSCEPDIVACEPDIVLCELDTVACEPDIVPCEPDIVPCETFSSMFENAPLEQWWGSPDENYSFAATLQDANEEGNEPIIYVPSRSHSRVRMPSRRTTRRRRKKKLKLLLTKEELDNELDQYMIDIKQF